MASTAFKAGDKVSWGGAKAVVVSDSPSDSDEVKVSVDNRVQTWKKMYAPYYGSREIPVIHEEW